MKIRNSVTELKDTLIYKYLKKINSDYAKMACAFVTAVSPILSTIRDYFPFYTRHDAHHGYRVLLRMQQILNKECFNSRKLLAFSEDECLLLICAAYAHDLGMAIFPGETSMLLSELSISPNGSWKQDKRLQRFLRDHHSQRGGKYISKDFELLKFPKNLVDLLDKLMEAHNLSINELDTKLGNRYSAGEKEIDLKQLACILCISDSLEFSETRVVDGVLEVLKRNILDGKDSESIESYRHNMQSICIGNGVAIGQDGKIIFTGNFDDPDILNLAHHTVDLIENWLKGYVDIDFQSSKKRLIIRADSVIRELTITGYDYERIGIRIKRENIIELIASNSTWSTDSAIVVRELLQNSVEACRYRAFHSSEAEGYIPKIKITLDKENRTICIQDNGCGMSRNVLLNNFLTVGNSRSSEPSYTTESYSSLARFGIGFWSAFTISETATIMTGPFEYLNVNKYEGKKVEGVKFDVSISEFKDYTIFQPNVVHPGTMIVLTLKEAFNMDEMVNRIPYHIGCSEIPIEFEVKAEHSFTIPKQISLPTLNDIFAAKYSYLIAQGIKEFNYQSVINDIDIKIKLLYIENQNEASFVLKSSESILGLQDRSITTMFRASGICGFLFNFHPQKSIIDLWRVGLLSANALNPKGFQFTLNRMGLIVNESYSNFVDTTAKAIHECYNNFLDYTGSNSAEQIAKLNQQSRANGGENFGTFTGTSLEFFYVNVPQLLAFKLYKIEQGKSVSNCEVLYAKLDTLIEQKFDLWLYSTPIYSTTIRFTPPASLNIYDLISKVYNITESSYLVENTKEADMIADNAEDVILFINIIPTINVRIPLRRFSSDKIGVANAMRYVLGKVQGIWTGDIVERELVGSNFCFLSHYHLVVKSGSLLAQDLKDLFLKKLHYKICKIASLLMEAEKGFIDNEVKKYV
jgi:hypothetical protein